MMDRLQSKPHLRDFHKLITNLLYSIICHSLLMWSLSTGQTSLPTIFKHTMTLAPLLVELARSTLWPVKILLLLYVVL